MLGIPQEVSRMKLLVIDCQGVRALLEGLMKESKVVAPHQREGERQWAFQEVKAWMAPLLYLAGPHFTDGRITSEYQASGAAVTTRNAAYPRAAIGALAAMAQTLRQAS